MTYTIGQIIPIERRRGIWHRPIDAAWYIFNTKPQQEIAASAWLVKNGALDAWFPHEIGWRKIARGRPRKIEYLRRIAPGYVFALLGNEPHWDVLFREARGKLTRVVSHNSVPMQIPESSIAQMQHVPRRIEEIREAARQARMIRPGDKAEITDGPLSGWVVDVTRIDAGIAHFVVPLLGERETAIPVARLERRQP